MLPLNLDTILDYIAELDPVVQASIRGYLAHCQEQEELPKVAEEEKVTGAAVDVIDDFFFAVLDQRHLLDRPEVKWYDPNTQLGDRTGKSRRTKKRGICFHHTAVEHGFGPHKNVLSKYLNLSRAPEFDGHVFGIDALKKIETEKTPHLVQLNRPMTLDAWAKMMALAGRMRGEGTPGAYNNGVSYQVIRCANSVLVLNLPFEWVPWASNGANTDFLGWAWDANSRKEGVDDADDLIADVVFTVDLARSEGHPIEEFTIHAAWTRKPDDPGAEFIRKVLEPAAEQTGCRIDYDFRAASTARSIGQVLAAA